MEKKQAFSFDKGLISCSKVYLFLKQKIKHFFMVYFCIQYHLCMHNSELEIIDYELFNKFWPLFLILKTSTFNFGFTIAGCSWQVN